MYQSLLEVIERTLIRRLGERDPRLSGSTHSKMYHSLGDSCILWGLERLVISHHIVVYH